MRPFRIGIAGGGIGGLALAHLLSKSPAGARGALAVTIFEREGGPGHRHQGYNLGLNPDGLAVLKRVAALGSPDLGVIIADKSCQLSSFSILDRSMAPILQFAPPGPPGSLVDRNVLRAALVNDLPAGIVRWGARITTLADVRDAEVDLLVGADGARSVVRTMVAPGLTYDDLGVTTVAGVAPLSAVPAALLAHVPEATLVRVLSGDGHTLLLMRAGAPPAQHLSAAMAPALLQAQSGLIWGISYPGHQTAWKAAGLVQPGEDVSGAQRLLLVCNRRVGLYTTTSMQALDEYASATNQGAVIDFCAAIAGRYFTDGV
jgi:2-polyprenyl-6-methoxyphenol hydroxylase-like FAD-dependent oxidoreductase